MRTKLSTREFAYPIYRTGATLSEVLIAILIMGIGLVGVISLFPAAVMRSVQGNTLTVGTTLRFNAESMLRIHPELLLDPDRNIAAEPAQFKPTDRDHNGYRYDDQANANFMVDPMGIINHSLADGAAVCTLPPGPFNPPISLMRRYGAGYSSLSSAESVFSGLDQWISRHEGVPTGGNLDPAATTQTLTLANLDKQTVYLGAGLAPTRAIIFNSAGSGCQIRALTTPTNNSPLLNTIAWNNSNLPGSFSNATFSNADIGTVRVEQQDLRFTWLMTAHGQTAGSTATADSLIYDVDMVIFYKRGYPPGDLVGYTNTSAVPNLAFRQNSLNVLLNWNTGTTAAPFLKKGGFILDGQNGYWYRVENYIEGAGSATITLATPARANSGVAIFMKGIVDVFPVRQVTLTNPKL